MRDRHPRAGSGSLVKDVAAIGDSQNVMVGMIPGGGEPLKLYVLIELMILTRDQTLAIGGRKQSDKLQRVCPRRNCRAAHDRAGTGACADPQPFYRKLCAVYRGPASVSL